MSGSPVVSANPHVARFVRRIREACAGRTRLDRPAHDLADTLRAERWRTPELGCLSPADDELIQTEIRRGTGT